jgi:hypothetical protein
VELTDLTRDLEGLRDEARASIAAAGDVATSALAPTLARELAIEAPRVRFFFIENDSNKVVQAGVKPFVVSLQAVFQFGNRVGKVLEKNG